MGTLSEPLPLDVLVGQLFVVVMRNERQLANALRDHTACHYGGVFLKRPNMREPDLVRSLAFKFRRHTKELPPMLVATDEEGGLVTSMERVTHPAPSAAVLGLIDETDLTRDVYQGIGEKLMALGINTVMAPVLDVNVEPKNPVIGTRSFGTTADRVARHGKAAVEGLRASAIACCVKHFPGHGATSLDSHETLPSVDANREALNERELLPFIQVLEKNPPEMVMSAHVAYKALDRSGTPATLSQPILTGLLRRELGFVGIIITDSMEMKAISDHKDPGKAALKAIDAGADLLLYGQDPEHALLAHGAVVAAVESGKLARKRIEESVNRTFLLRDRFRGLSWMDEARADEVLLMEHDQVFYRAAMDGIVLEGNAGVLKQIPSAPRPKLAVFPRELNSHHRLPLHVVREQLEPEGFSVLEVSPRPTPEEIRTASEQAAQASVIVVGTASRGAMPEESKKLVGALTGRDVIKVGVALLDPGDADHMMAANCRMKTLGFTVPQVWAMCQKLMG